jgi:hypothetical protein
MKNSDSLSAVRTKFHPVRTPICPLFHPSGRRVIPSGRQTDQHHPSKRRIFPSGPSIVSRSFCSSLHPSGHLSNPSGRPSVIDQLQILSKFRYGKIDTPSGQRGLPSGRTHTWGKNRNSNITVQTSVSIGPDARSSVKEIADSTSTVLTSASHGPDACITDMEIACWRIVVRTFIPLGSDALSLIWKLLAADVRPSGRQYLTIRTWLLNRKDFQPNFWKILSHSCLSGRLRFTVRTASVHITIVAHSAPQPINRGPWALRTARIRYWILQDLIEVQDPSEAVTSVLRYI